MPLITRYIDDLFGIVLMRDKNGMAESEWNEFENDMNNSGILTWEVEKTIQICHIFGPNN